MRNEFFCKIKWKHIFLLLFCFLCMMAIMRYTALQVKVISGGTSVLDLSLGKLVEHIRQTLIGLGYDGRMYYLNLFLVVDCIYAMVYAMFYFCSIIFLLHKNDIRRKRVYIFFRVAYSRHVFCLVRKSFFKVSVSEWHNGIGSLVYVI